MPKSFDLDKAVTEFRALTARIAAPSTPSGTRKQLEKRVADLRAAYVAWNGSDGDELAEIAAEDFSEGTGE